MKQYLKETQNGLSSQEKFEQEWMQALDEWDVLEELQQVLEELQQKQMREALLRDQQKHNDCREIQAQASSSPKIAMPPGHFYTSLGKIILNKRAYERVMEQSILMMQEEYFEAYSKGDIKRARWIKARFIFEFLIILGLNLPILKQLLDIKDKFAK